MNSTVRRLADEAAGATAPGATFSPRGGAAGGSGTMASMLPTGNPSMAAATLAMQAALQFGSMRRPGSATTRRGWGARRRAIAAAEQKQLER